MTTHFIWTRANPDTMVPEVRPPIASQPTSAGFSKRPHWAWMRGFLILGVLVWLMGFAKLNWTVYLSCWVVGTLLLAEWAGKGFSYLGLASGGLVFANDPALAKDLLETWWICAPVVTGALWLYLLIRHLGGVGVIPLAALGYVAPWLLYRLLLPKLDDFSGSDSLLKIPIGEAFSRAFLGSLLTGLTTLALGYIVLNVLAWRKTKIHIHSTGESI